MWQTKENSQSLAFKLVFKLSFKLAFKLSFSLCSICSSYYHSSAWTTFARSPAVFGSHRQLHRQFPKDSTSQLFSPFLSVSGSPLFSRLHGLPQVEDIHRLLHVSLEENQMRSPSPAMSQLPKIGSHVLRLRHKALLAASSQIHAQWAQSHPGPGRLSQRRQAGQLFPATKSVVCGVGKGLRDV